MKITKECIIIISIKDKMKAKVLQRKFELIVIRKGGDFWHKYVNY